jgi:flagellin-like hook-associated protein FlgL
MAMEAAPAVRESKPARRGAVSGYPPQAAAAGALTTEQERVLLEHLPIVRFLARRIHERLADYSSGEVNTALAANDTTALSTALNYVSQQRVTIDSSITQLSAAAGAVTSEKTQLTAAQTDLMQADLPTIATQLSLAETQQTALEDVIAQLDSTANSLFSKLQG